MSARTEAAPIAALYGVEFSPWIRRVALLLLILFVIAPVVVLFAPWQQNVTGAGRVAAFTPLDRPQTVEATINGRVAAVHVTEGQRVEKGDLLVELVDIDPQAMGRIAERIEANDNEVRAVTMQVEAYEAQVKTLELAREMTVQGAQFKIEAAQEKRKGAEQNLVRARVDLSYAQLELGRLEPLVPEGFVEELKVIKARAEVDKANASVERALAELAEAEADIGGARRDQSKAREEANAKIQESQGKLQSVLSKAQEIRGKNVDLQGELRTQQAQDIRAPRAGRVFRLAVNPDGSIVKKGDDLLEIVPVVARPAVELYVRGVDAPLIESGRKVRLQFEGWPAVQFVGWPSVAVGTFGGVVSLVDPTDSGNGRFRLLIEPDPDDLPWPDERWLRQGVRAKGWVLLNEVPLWYELWRQLNGFPPVVSLGQPRVSGEEVGK